MDRGHGNFVGSKLQWQADIELCRSSCLGDCVLRWQLVVMLAGFESEKGPQRRAATIQPALLETAANAKWCAESGPSHHLSLATSGWQRRHGQVDYKRPHMVRTMNMTDVMLRRSGRIKAGLEERVLNRFHKQMLQSNRTVTEQDLSFWLLAALLRNSVNVTCGLFCIPWTVTSCVSDDTCGYNWDHLGSWKNKWAVADTFAKYRTLSSCGVPMEPRTKSRACMFRSRSC